MKEINQREEELGRVRDLLVGAQEENKGLTVSREKMRQQNDFIAKELKTMEYEFGLQKKKIEEQERLIDSLCVTQKVANPSFKKSGPGGHDAMMQSANEESQKNERIAQGTNRSTFLHLGEKKVKMVQENDHPLLSRQKLPHMQSDAQRKDQGYIADESVPAQIFPLIENYRERIMEISNGREQSALIIDDFFGDAHTILKDTHLKEIARIRNENNVEIMKLKKNLEQRLLKEGMTRSQVSGSFDNKAKENMNAYNVKDVFADNEAERQRRMLNEENQILKKRLRAVETIANSGNLERIKFMEGASWVANKSMQEANQFNQKLEGLLMEYDRRSTLCVVDASIKEINGVEFIKLRDWTCDFLGKEA